MPLTPPASVGSPTLSFCRRSREYRCLAWRLSSLVVLWAGPSHSAMLLSMEGIVTRPSASRTLTPTPSSTLSCGGGSGHTHRRTRTSPLLEERSTARPALTLLSGLGVAPLSRWMRVHGQRQSTHVRLVQLSEHEPHIAKWPHGSMMTVATLSEHTTHTPIRATSPTTGTRVGWRQP